VLVAGRLVGLDIGACELVTGGLVGLLLAFPAAGLLGAADAVAFPVGAGVDELSAAAVGSLTVLFSVSAGSVVCVGSLVGSDVTVVGVPETSAFDSVVLFAVQAAIVSVRITARSNIIFFKQNTSFQAQQYIQHFTKVKPKPQEKGHFRQN